MNFDSIFPDIRETGDSRLRQCQLVMLRMLKVFDYLCLKHDIKYFLTGGSLLGAVRHKGFIPWDDDLDVGMTRENYEKFVRVAVADLPNDIFFQTPQTDQYYPVNSNVDARLRDKYSSYIHRDGCANKWHEGLQLDIFVYDCAYLPHNLFVITSNKILKLLNDNRKRAAILKLLSKFLPFPKVYSSNFLQYFSEIRYGTYITKSEYSSLVRSDFEDMQTYIPAKYHTYLQRQYGDYMRLPPEEKRVSHHHVDMDPFHPCDHPEILFWERRKAV
jgi:lipopolysaccharide cholinephosphotransferase